MWYVNSKGVNMAENYTTEEVKVGLDQIKQKRAGFHGRTIQRWENDEIVDCRLYQIERKRKNKEEQKCK